MEICVCFLFFHFCLAKKFHIIDLNVYIKYENHHVVSFITQVYLLKANKINKSIILKCTKNPIIMLNNYLRMFQLREPLDFSFCSNIKSNIVFITINNENLLLVVCVHVEKATHKTNYYIFKCFVSIETILSSIFNECFHQCIRVFRHSNDEPFRRHTPYTYQYNFKS